VAGHPCQRDLLHLDDVLRRCARPPGGGGLLYKVYCKRGGNAHGCFALSSALTGICCCMPHLIRVTCRRRQPARRQLVQVQAVHDAPDGHQLLVRVCFASCLFLGICITHGALVCIRNALHRRACNASEMHCIRNALHRTWVQHCPYFVAHLRRPLPFHKNTAARRAPAGRPSTATARCRTASTRRSSSPVRLGWELGFTVEGPALRILSLSATPTPHTHNAQRTTTNAQTTSKTVTHKQGSPACRATPRAPSTPRASRTTQRRRRCASSGCRRSILQSSLATRRRSRRRRSWARATGAPRGARSRAAATTRRGACVCVVPGSAF
jgi:hypothetical protein